MPPPTCFTIDPSVEQFNVSAEQWLVNNDKHFSGMATAGLIFAYPAQIIRDSSSSSPPTAPTTENEKTSASGEDNEPRILLLQRAPTDSMPLRWEPPGGAVDSDDETLLVGCAREVWEESGLVVRRVVEVIPAGCYAFTNRSGSRVFWRVSFEVEVVGQESESGGSVGGGEKLGVRCAEEEHVDWWWARKSEVEKGRMDDGRELKLTTALVRAMILEAFNLRQERMEG